MRDLVAQTRTRSNVVISERPDGAGEGLNTCWRSAAQWKELHEVSSGSSSRALA